jgi:DNA-binding response OmpR family regulator
LPVQEAATPDQGSRVAVLSTLPLMGRKVLVVEDECLVAEDFAAILREAGAEVIGPAETLPQAIRLAQNGPPPDAALLDIDLDGTAVFPLAEQLRAEGVLMLFLTGMGCDDVPDELADVLCIAKPIIAARVVDELAALMGPVTAAA